MSVVVIQVFVSLLLVAGSLVLFVHSVRQRDFDHADRLALAPLDEDDDLPRNPQTGSEPPAKREDSPTPTPETPSPCKQNRSNTTTP